MQVSELLDRAKKHTGSDAETARLLDVSAARVYEWRADRRPCPITVQASICGIAGMTEGEQMRFIWEVVRGRMGKPTGEALGVVAWIGFMAADFAQHAVSRGSAAATMYKALTTDRQSYVCQLGFSAAM